MPPSESDFLDWIRSQQKPSSLVRLAAGDDLAVLNWPGGDLLLVGADQVLDGVHFDSTRHTPREIGRKAMNRNLSDCAAMACLPAAAIATVALPRGLGMEYAKELYLGLRDAGDAFDCPIVGGDTGSWDAKLALSVTILGRADGIAPITRSGAKAGDGIYVTGPLGGSILGRHMTFTPRVNEARKITKAVSVSSMIDISDGLAIDLSRICAQSNVGAVLDAAAIPIHADAIALSRQSRKPPLDHALHDGEDHELLFTSAARPPVGLLIGKITADRSLLIHENGKTAPLSIKGWDHSL
jgi:thiamine-monophosphate kinase